MPRSRLISSRLITNFSWIALVLVAFVFRFDARAQPSVVTVLPGQSVSFSQVDFTWEGATTLNSSTGQVDVDIAILQSSTGISSGFINISTDLGWVVQNLPVFSGFPYPSISTNFQLSTSSGIDITSLDAFVEFSAAPRTSSPTGPFTTFAVGDIEYNAQGGEGTVVGVPTPPSPGVIIFDPVGLLKFCFQPNHSNIQTAHNQCVPAAVATSLQWLEDTYGINVPQPNNLGLGTDVDNDGNADDGTLVVS
jgi:hypothetical protein